MGQSNDYETLLNSEITTRIYVAVPPAGSRPPAAVAHRVLGYNPAQLLTVANENNSYCLFYAIGVSLLYRDQKIIGELKKQKKCAPKYLINTDFFNKRFLHNDERQKREAITLMKMADVAMDKTQWVNIIYLFDL